MSDLLDEQLSALVDGELPPEQTALLLKRLGREPELAARLGRYRLFGDVLRGERGSPRADFAMRISAAVAAEPAFAPLPVSGRRWSAPGWLRPAAGLAVAASVGMLAVLVLQRTAVMTPPPSLATAVVAPSPAREAAREPTRALRTSPGTGEPVSYVTPAARPGLATISGATLANYVVAHSEASSALAGRSILIHLLADEPSGDAPTR